MNHNLSWLHLSTFPEPIQTTIDKMLQPWWMLSNVCVTINFQVVQHNAKLPLACHTLSSYLTVCVMTDDQTAPGCGTFKIQILGWKLVKSPFVLDWKEWRPSVGAQLVLLFDSNWIELIYIYIFYCRDTIYRPVNVRPQFECTHCNESYLHFSGLFV